MTVSDQTKAYMADPNTKVYIKFNNDTGEWLYSVIVEGSGDFWLDAFRTEQKALDFIKMNNLKRG